MACFIVAPQYAGMVAPGPLTMRGMPLNLHASPKWGKLVYGSGKSVVVRSLADPSDCFVYRGHNFLVTCAKFSPTGFWVASGDASGRVRVWSWDHPEHLLKVEIQVMACAVKDIDWDPESKRIVAVGDGTQQNASSRAASRRLLCRRCEETRSLCDTLSSLHLYSRHAEADARLHVGHGQLGRRARRPLEARDLVRVQAEPPVPDLHELRGLQDHVLRRPVTHTHCFDTCPPSGIGGGGGRSHQRMSRRKSRDMR